MTARDAGGQQRVGGLIEQRHPGADAFEEHAVLKGGMALRLFDCPRSTNDLDYVFVPFASKDDIRARIEAALSELPDARISIAVHSKMLRATVRVDDASIQIEANVGLECRATPMPTASFALAQGQPSRIVRVMALDHALAHKLAAWNERRLLRDLWECYFLSARLGEVPDLPELDRRLQRVESRLPHLAKRRSMTRAELAAELRAAADGLTEAALRAELAPVLPPDELVGLVPRLHSAAIRLAERLEGEGVD